MARIALARVGNAARAALLIVLAAAGCQPPQSTEESQATPRKLQAETPAVAAPPQEVPPVIPPAVANPPDDAAAARATLAIGDPAPPLRLASWLKGEPLSEFADGQVYVIEFWATWCGPCRVSMPHLSQLQTEYGSDVTFLGISDEHEESVRNFLAEVSDPLMGKTWDETISYRIALDAEGEPTGGAYMRAAGQNGIPTAFVIGRDRHLEWIGHPLEIDEPLAKVVAGEWDRAAALAQFQARQRVEQLMSQLRGAVRDGRASGDWSAVNRLLDTAEQAGVPAAMLLRLRFDTAVLSEQFESAHDHARQLSLAVWEDSQQLNSLAWDLVTRIPRDQQDHKLALLIARRASELTNDQDAAVLDTVARVHYEASEIQEAVDWQRKAAEHAPPGMDEISRTLNRYEAELEEK